MDLATQWVSDFSSPRLAGVTKDLLRIPEHYVIYDAIPLGYPTYYPKPRYVKPLEELVHYCKYDMNKYRTDKDIREFISERQAQFIGFKESE